MSLLDSVIGALGSQRGAGGGSNSQAALLRAVLGMLMQGGAQQGGGQQGGTQASGGLGGLGGLMAGLGGGGQSGAGGGLGGLLGGLAQMSGGGGGGGGDAAGVGGGLGGGLGALVEQFSRAGLGDAAKSWVGTGQNQAVSGDQITQVFGGDTIGNLARQLGMDPGEVAGQMSQMLPDVVDRLTPGGQLPQGNDLSALGNIDGLLNGLLRR